MLCVNNLYKKYKNAETPSVNDLSFTFEKGKIIGLLGPNGAGKTTTISILCGLINQFEGDVKVLGYDIRTQANIIRGIVSVVPQQIALYPTLSCYENLLYYGKLYNINASKLKETIHQYLDDFGLKDHLHKQIKHYSGGMKRRANIIASLLNHPHLLILDEPTAGVDVHSRSMILHFLKQYNAAGNSVIYTSHLLEEAETICDEVLIIDNGKKIVQGSPEALITQYQTNNLENVFIKLTGNQVRD
ncbi:MAG: ABC transporter ATP-binding protein [Bacteroidetes bacterium]|jgi:ABC-2 type transport system ATP-binding protein|nr:ABC transporter ATP-binding protein [Bacteroidota bacterium]HMT34996.1 ABC transporter ATP-binding protein [Chitinophagaceae bacterium]MBK7587421.1 ABC transporter ATP-binding protein [Bacteroidota bacterium]MBK8329823.1 ABC transporter ATP-binding protein [Bacteroidota bacterium]MBK9301625.1 ABC transporter ATP-binding protein [Bacteroidota bacterium]